MTDIRSTKQVFHFDRDDGTTVPPFVVKYSRYLMDGKLLAVSDEDGFVTLFEHDAKKGHESKAAVAKWEAHENSVFDLTWTKGDRHMATASGDQTAQLWDVERAQCLAVLQGHHGSVKSIQSRDEQGNVFATGARDGNVCIWDTRFRDTSGGSGSPSSVAGAAAAALRPGAASIRPCMIMRNVHIQPRPSRAKKGKIDPSATNSQQSVTAVVFMPCDRVLATAGAADGLVKLWDLRKHSNAQPRELASLSPAAGSAGYDHTSGVAGRNFGVSAMSIDSSGTRLATASKDMMVHCYDLLQTKRAPKAFGGGSYMCGSFYIKVAFSPEGDFIASGSSDNNVYIWDTQSTGAPAAVLEGHEGEVSSVDWCRSEFGTLASCSDDATVRMWKVQTELRSERDGKRVRRRLDLRSPVAPRRPVAPVQTPRVRPLRQPNIAELWQSPLGRGRSGRGGSRHAI